MKCIWFETQHRYCEKDVRFFRNARLSSNRMVMLFVCDAPWGSINSILCTVVSCRKHNYNPVGIPFIATTGIVLLCSKITGIVSHIWRRGKGCLMRPCSIGISLFQCTRGNIYGRTVAPRPCQKYNIHVAWKGKPRTFKYWILIWYDLARRCTTKQENTDET